MKIILLIGSGSNHKSLANKINEKYNLAAVIVEKHDKVRLSPLLFFLRGMEKFLFLKIDYVWKKLMKYYDKIHPNYPETVVVFTNNINDKLNVEFINNLEPDLILVSGTRLIKDEFLKSVKCLKGIINLHTGLSPYIKGGPNCTNWCISENKWNYIGNTVMWINKGIDSGNIITTETTPFDGNEKLYDIHLKVMEHAHIIYLKVIDAFLKNKRIPSVPQNSIAEGRLYLNKMWNFKSKLNLIINMNKRIIYHDSSNPILIPLED